MTDKQIIIDGVDVSGCSWHTQGATGMICADWHISNDCSKNPNCYYKQLKAKEQECEGLGQAYLETNELLQEKTKECTNLKAENEELKKCYKNNSALLDFDETNTTKLVNKVMKLEQTLKEIKEIAQIACEKSVCDRKHCDYCSDGRIIQKIKEVINE